MKSIWNTAFGRRGLAAVLVLGLCLAAQSLFLASETKTGLKVCPDPAAPCQSAQKTFAPFELSYQLPKRLGANVIYESAPFYAVVLLTQRSADCDGGEYTSRIEQVRKQAQKLFPDRKAFADHQCPNMDAVFYSIDGKPNAQVVVAGGGRRLGAGPEPIDGKPNAQVVVAVYAGETEAVGRRVLAQAKARYPAAALRKVRVGFSRVVQ